MSEEQTNILTDPDNRRKVYAFSLLGCVLGLAIIGLMSIWNVGISESLTFKLIVTFIIMGALSVFLYALTYRHGEKKIKLLGFVTGICAISLAGISLAQLWFTAFEKVFFGQLAVTLVIIGLIAAFFIAVFDDFFENRKMKDENYLD